MNRNSSIKRSPMPRGTSQLKSTKPMNRGTGMKRAASATKAPAARPKLKAKGPRMTPARKAAKGQECTLAIFGVCNFDPTTTVLCHSPFLADGRGMGLKSPDSIAAFGCSCCHDVLDGRRPRPPGVTQIAIEGVFYVAVQITQAILANRGIHPD